MLRAVFGWLSGGVLDRVLDTIDRKVQSETDREKLRTEAVREHMRTRADWMRAGGFWTLLAFAAPVIFHFSAVVLYSVFWCTGCAYPQPWSIAALPGPMAQWEGWIVLASIGGLSLLGIKR